jgi:biopolymer transport protein ExbB
MSETTELPTIREIEGLWYELQREMVASGQVVSFETTVIDVDGESSTCNVTRVGLFNAVCDGKYLEYVSAQDNMHFYQDSQLVVIQKLLRKLEMLKLAKR